MTTNSIITASLILAIANMSIQTTESSAVNESETQE